MLCHIGRKVRSEVVDAVGKTREVINLVRSEARSMGLELFTPDKHVSAPLSGSAALANATSTANAVATYFDSLSGMTLAEALGISDFVDAVHSLKETIPWLKDRSKASMQIESQLRSLRDENNELQSQLRSQSQRHDEHSRKLQDEIHVLTKQTSELQRLKASQNQSSHHRDREGSVSSGNDGASKVHIHSLELEVKRERESKLVVMEENQLLRTKIGHLESDLNDAKKRLELLSKSNVSEVGMNPLLLLFYDH